MNCNRAEKMLMQELDGELDATAQAVLAAHLESCAACRETARAWREAGALLRSQAVPVPSADVMWTDVRRAIRQLPAVEPAASLLGWRLRWATAIVATVFIGMMGFGAWRLQVQTRIATAPSEPDVEWVEAELPGSSPMVYEDEATDTVVIWLMTAENGEEAPKGS